MQGMALGTKFDMLVEVNALIEQGRFEEIRSRYRSDFRGWSPTYDFVGFDGYVEALKAQNGPFSEAATTMALVTESDEVVVFEWAWAGTHTGTIEAAGFELPATGKRISMKGIAVFEFVGDQPSAVRQYWDNAAVGAQFM